MVKYIATHQGIAAHSYVTQAMRMGLLSIYGVVSPVFRPVTMIQASQILKMSSCSLRSALKLAAESRGGWPKPKRDVDCDRCLSSHGLRGAKRSDSLSIKIKAFGSAKPSPVI